MHKIFFYILIGATFFNIQSLSAQQDAQFSYYMKNLLYFNPAFAGVDGTTQITSLTRSQWTGYPGNDAPTTQVFSLNTPIFKFRSGFGAHIVYDDLGPLNNVDVQLSYAYHLGIKNSKLSFGIRTGIYSQTINFDRYQPIDQDDPFLKNRNGVESQVRPDVSLGLFYRAEKYYAGLSFSHLLESQFDFGANEVRNALENHAYLTFGYIHTVNFDLKLEPSLMVQTDLNEYNFIIGGLAYYKDKMWGGLSFRQADDVNVLLGYNFLKDNALSFGYSFGYVVANQDAKQPTTHEVLLSYQLPVHVKSGKKIVRTPRFR